MAATGRAVQLMKLTSFGERVFVLLDVKMPTTETIGEGGDEILVFSAAR